MSSSLVSPTAISRVGRILSGALFLLAVPLISTTPAQAQVCGNGLLEYNEVCDWGLTSDCDEFCQDPTSSCIDDVTGVTNNCTANDVRLALVINETDVFCEMGDDVTLHLIGELQATSNQRWDIGVFVALDGGTARTGACWKAFLDGVNPPLAPTLPACMGTCSASGEACFKDEDCLGFPSGETCIGGYNPGTLTLDANGQITFFENGGPFYDGECAEDPNDICGDLEQGVNNFYHFGQPVTVPCVDNDGDGKVDIGSCLSWDNARSYGIPNSPSCTSIRDTVPNTRAKCNCETINIGNVYVAGRIVVDKVTVPAGSTQLFDFVMRQSGETDPIATFQLTDADDPYAKGGLQPTFVAGVTYSVDETPVPVGWDLVNVECLGAEGVVEDPAAIDLGSGETVTCTCTNVEAAVDLTKSCGALAKAGDSIPYELTVTNNTGEGADDLVCQVTDPLLGLDQSVTLAPGASQTINVSRTALPTDPDPLSNTASVSCTFGGTGDEVASDEASCQTNLFQPAVTFEKTGDALSKLGDPTDYTITLNNTSSADTPDLTCTITDAAVGVSKVVTLAAGGSDVTNVTAPIPAGAADPYVNTASYSCTVAGFPNILSGSASHSVNLFQPSVTIDKSGDALSKVGDTVDYEITVENTSSADTPNLVCTVTDTMLGVSKSVTLASGASDVANASRTVLEGDPDPLVNTASVSCSPAGFPNVLTGSASHSVNLFQPSLTIDKTGDALSKVGDAVDYTITLSNTSSADTPDLACTITDAMLGVSESVTLASGAQNVTNASRTVLPGDPDPLVNTVSVSCSPAGFPNVLSGSASHAVDLFQPSIDLTKIGDTLSKVGDTVDYVITLYNTSSADTPDLSCTITDATVGVDETFSVVSGGSHGVNVNGFVIPAGAADPFVNTANVTCSPAGFPNVLTDSASHSVELFQASIDLTKTGDALSKAGDTVDYVITLYDTSSADTPDLNCTVTDAAVGVSETFSVVSGGNHSVNVYDFVIPAGADPFVNTATVTCSPAGFPNVLTDSASHSVNLFEAAIDLTKTGPSLGKAGDPVDYVITLENNSSADTPDLTCSVSDSLVGVDETFTIASGLDHVVNVTDFTIPAGAADPFVNTASVTCMPAGFANVLMDTASHSIDLFQAAIELTKTGPPLSKAGDPVDYVITLENNSSADTPDLTCSVSDALVGVDETFTVGSGLDHVVNVFDFLIPAGAADPFVNTATVTCSPAGFPNVLDDSASWSIGLFQAAINLTKTGPSLGKAGDPVDYVITLENNSSADTPDLTCTVTDALVGVDETFTIASGLDHVVNVTDFTIPAGAADPFVNTANVTCSPAGFPNVLTDSASHSIDLFQAAIELTKTGPPLSKVGDPVDYVITLENNSSAETPDLTCTVTDALVGVDETFTVGSGLDHVVNVTDFTIPAGAADPFVNTANVTCSPAGFPNVLTDSASHSIDLFEAAVVLTKTGDEVSKVGDGVTYTITLQNNSSVETPDLGCTITDAQIGFTKSVTLASGATDVSTVPWTIPAGAGDPYTNTASVSCSAAGFPNVFTASAGHSIDLVHPSYTVTKTCANQPIPQAGPALFAVTFVNDGDVALVISADDGIGSFTLPAGESTTYPVSIDGPFTGQASVVNQVTASATIDLPGLPNVLPGTSTVSCQVGGLVELEKWTNGAPNDGSQGMTWTFLLRGPGLPAEGVVDTSPPPLVDFGDANLVPGEPYQLCEVLIPTAWTLQWKGDADFDGVPETIIPQVIANSSPIDPTTGYSNVYDPNYLPPPAIFDNSERCVDFVVLPGATKAFQIDNQYPGGEPRTIGYWKNWNSCTGGGQMQTAAENGGPANGWYTLDDVLEPPGILIGDLFLTAEPGVPTCEPGIQNAVYILDKRDLEGVKRANDAAYNLAAQLLAALANFTAGAETCADAQAATAEAQALLEGSLVINGRSIDFTGYGPYLDPATTRKTKAFALATRANQLAATLDAYNNGILCGPLPPLAPTKSLTAKPTTDR